MQPQSLPESTIQQFLKGSTTIVVGAPGTGKTFVLPTFIDAGLELFVIITDPGGEESLLAAMEFHNLPIDKLHWHYIPPASVGWDVLIKQATNVTALSYKGLTEIKSGIEKDKHQQWTELLHVLYNFKCDRTGEEFGPVDSWGPNRACAIDTLSGLNTMAFDLMVGAKPLAHEGEYGVAMNLIEKLIKKCCSDLRCFFVLNAHLSQEFNPVDMRVKFGVQALGKKLGPKLPKDFSDVVEAYREGTDFYWSTADVNIDLKSRLLPLKDKLQPDFRQIVKVWQKRRDLYAPTHEVAEEANIVATS